MFTVQAQDYGRPALSSTVTVYFNVVDLNDNQPVFQSTSYSTEILENVTIGTSVLSVFAQDLDSGKFAQLSFLYFVSLNPCLNFVNRNNQIRHL